MLFALVLGLTIGCIAFILARQARTAPLATPLVTPRAAQLATPLAGRPRRTSLRGYLRSRGWSLLLLPVAMSAAMLAGGAHGLAGAELSLAALAIVFAPRLGAKLVPYGVLALAVFGFILARAYQDGHTGPVQYAFIDAGPAVWSRWPVLAEATVLLAAGLWLLLRLDAPPGGQLRLVGARWLSGGRDGISAFHGLLLIPVVGFAMLLLGPGNWFDLRAVDGLDAALIDLAMCTGGLVLILRSRVWAATLAAAGLLVLGAYGWLIALFGVAMPGFAYGFADLHNSPVPAARWGDALQGLILLAAGLWLAPRVIRRHPGSALDLELAARAQQLTRRVQTLTQTRRDVVDTAAAELRRIERDLHDGAQARLVALGMSLQAAQRLFPVNPEAALALVAEAKESSSLALTELRDLVRGIYPPVLADRGLADAVRALALDTPLPVELDVDVPGVVELPVASAVYFSVAEILTNVTKHAAAHRVTIQLSFSAAAGAPSRGSSSGRPGLLRLQVTDDGCGGADPAHGTGLAGVERRLAAFDGILATSSPPGGPTIIVIEVPCALSSPKTSTC